MGLLDKLGISRKSKEITVADAVKVLRSSYVAANNNRAREKHFADATSTDADSAISGELSTIRDRARLETRNNSYARGVANIGANFVVGDGPHIQMKTENEDFNERFERDFAAWSRVADASGRMSLADMLRIGEMQLYPCGEYLFVKAGWHDRRTPVDLRYRMIEVDRLKTPDDKTSDDSIRDGVKLNKDGRPVAYYILKNHPGRNTCTSYEAVEWDASEVIHEAIITRPEQTRGEPILASSLPLFADFRRFTNATLGAAEAAALFAVLLESTSDEEYGEVPPEIFDIEPRTIATMPPGTKVSQVKPEHPATNFPQFKREFLSEVGAGAGMPYNVVAMDSSSHNYASGRIDWQAFSQAISVRRHRVKINVLSQIVGDFLDEWLLIPGNQYSEEIKNQAYYMFDALWPGLPHIDPAKEAIAFERLLANNGTTLEDWWAAKGFDYRKKLEQRKKEKELYGTPEPSTPAAEPNKDT